MSSKLIDENPLIILPSLAVKIGLNEAVFMQQIHFWLLMKKNIHDGYYWTYNTHDKWLQQFPFWSKSTLRRIIDSLLEKELIICGRFNKKNYDKTKWYRINYDKLNDLTKDLKSFDGKAYVQNEKACVQNEHMDVFKMNTPIPKTSTKTNNNINTLPDLNQEKEKQFEEFWILYKKRGGRKKSKEKFMKLLKNHSFDEIMNHTNKYINYVFAKNGNFQYLKHCETFLNNFDIKDEFYLETKQVKNNTFNPWEVNDVRGTNQTNILGNSGSVSNSIKQIGFGDVL